MNAAKAERLFLPHVGHITPDVVIDQTGALYAVWHLAGFAADLAGAAATADMHLRNNRLDMNIAEPRAELWDHFVRQDGQVMSSLPAVGNWFASRFDDAYRATQGAGQLYRNDLFVTIVFRPDDTLRGGMKALAGVSARAHPVASDTMMEQFSGLLHKVGDALARYGARRLGLRSDGAMVFSEMFEAMHLIANCTFRPIGLTTGRMGSLVVPERVRFAPMEMQFIAPGRPHFAALVTFKDYPAATSPVMFAKLREVPFAIVVTNSKRYQGKAGALDRIRARVNQMKSGQDEALRQIAELGQDADKVRGGESVYVHHHYSVAIHAASLAKLDLHVATVQNILADAGVTAIRETDALKPGFYAQVPGNRLWATRPAPVKSINAVGMAPRHDVPRGNYRGRWGAPLMMLRTTSDTEYAFHFHVQGSAQIAAEDLGNMLLIGPSGSGKTGLLGSACLLALRQAQARVVVIDKNFGLSVMVRAAGGSYLVLEPGHPSGLSPLRGLTDSVEDVAFIERFVRNLILSDDAGELTPDEDRRLQRGVARQMRMPVEVRSLAGVAVYLGQRSATGAAARLRKWCCGERLGWAFDGEQDTLDFSKRITGIETGWLLKDATVCSPTLSYLFFRIRKLINGLPLVLAIDECWQADKVQSFQEENNDHLKTIRKNEGVVVLATQSAHDALASPNAHTFKQQIPTKIFFGDTAANWNELVDGLDLTAAEFDAVKSLLPDMKHSFLIKRPSGSVLCRFDLSGAKDKVAVISGRASTYDLMNRLIARHGDDPEAWVPHFEREAPRLVEAPVGHLMEAAE